MTIFSDDKIHKIFKCYENEDPYKIISRESTTLEFKTSFSTSAIPKYAKTMAAYANRDGGYLIFGVKNNPRIVVGLKDSIFENYDDEKFVEKLNEYFSPEINYDRTTIKYKDKIIGIIYVYSSNAKPVVCRNTYQSGGKLLLREGAIYYRYRAKSEEIKYPDLRILLEQAKEQERKLWLQTFTKISKIGVNNLSLLNLKNGELSTNGKLSKSQLFVSNEILSQIKLIKEGQFDEKEGAPTLKLVGEIQNITGALVKQTKTIKQIIPTNMTEKYLLQTFINQTGTESAMNYIDAFCHFSVKYLPFYYYIYIIQKSDPNFDLQKLKAEINKITEDSKLGKKFLLERLKSDDNFKQEKLTGKECDIKIKYLKLFNDSNTKPNDIPEEHIDIQLKMILSISNEDRIKKLIIPILNKYLNSCYDQYKPLLRKAIAYIDKQLYYNKLNNFS